METIDVVARGRVFTLEGLSLESTKDEVTTYYFRTRVWENGAPIESDGFRRDSLEASMDAAFDYVKTLVKETPK